MANSSVPQHAGGRRYFLQEGWWWVKLVAAGLVSYPFFRFLGFAVPRKPRYVEVHKTLAVGGFHLERDFILFEGISGPWAVSRKCTHLGCRVNYHEKNKMLICPCHQSMYTTSGKVIKGPARRDLPIFQVARTDEGRGYIVTL